MKRESSTIDLHLPIEVTQQNWGNDFQPVVSVFSWVYNHKKFIRESIESILIQKTTFPIEIIIHDDASNDGTKEIIIEYQEKFPGLFRNVLHDENQLSQGKSVMNQLFEKPRGKYIALTHGDDYWTDPYKLQKQINFLEQNSEFSICFTRADVLNDETKEVLFYQPNLDNSKNFTLEDFLKNNPCATASVVFNRESIVNPPKWFFKSPFGDYAIYLLILYKSKQKKAHYLSDITCVYRIHVNSIHGSAHISNSKLIKAYKEHLFFWMLIKMYLIKDDIYKVQIKKTIIDNYKNLINVLINEKSYKSLIIYLIRFLIESKFKKIAIKYAFNSIRKVIPNY